MTGVRIGAVEVAGRAPNERGNAAWHCRCDCGSRFVCQGIRLRDIQKRGSAAAFACDGCKAKRRGRRGSAAA